MSTTSKTPLRLALIGLGRMGNNYLNSVKQLKEVQISWICSKTQKSLEELPSIYGKTSDYKTLVLKNGLDGVIIATPAPSHFEIAEFFLKNRIPLLIEKPLVTNPAEAEKLLTIQKQTQTQTQTQTPSIVGHTLLFYPAIKLL